MTMGAVLLCAPRKVLGLAGSRRRKEWFAFELKIKWNKKFKISDKIKKKKTTLT